MAIRDQMAANAAPLLGADEKIQAVFGAQTVSQYLSLISYWIIIIKNAYRVVVVTDKRILVCGSGRFRTTPVNGVIRELPRTTKIGQPEGLWWKCETLGEKLYINKRFHKDVREADGLAPIG
jgi:hypothetical protein